MSSGRVPFPRPAPFRRPARTPGAAPSAEHRTDQSVLTYEAPSQNEKGGQGGRTRGDYLTRSRYWSLRVSIFIRSPTLTKKGTLMTAPVSTVAGLPPPEAVSPFSLPAVSVTSSSTSWGPQCSRWGPCEITVTSMFSFRYLTPSPICSFQTPIWSNVSRSMSNSRCRRCKGTAWGGAPGKPAPCARRPARSFERAPVLTFLRADRTNARLAGLTC